MFQFKQFAVDQSGCAMKINTDGVLLAALADCKNASKIIDIGSGTGVIALMLTQRYYKAIIDAIDIDQTAANTAKRNFANSPFTDRLTSYCYSFQNFFKAYPGRFYDVIVSNPPFYTNSLKSPFDGKSVAKHADISFFKDLLSILAGQLNSGGLLYLILPIDTAVIVDNRALTYGFHKRHIINIKSFSTNSPHRQIVSYSKAEADLITEDFVIYESPKEYSLQYKELLKPFFTIF